MTALPENGIQVDITNPQDIRAKRNQVKNLIKETIFDSSVKRNEEIEFGLGQVIAGWRDGLVGMKVGGTRVLHLAPEVAYGARGAGGLIGPNATLVFRVELKGVK